MVSNKGTIMAVSHSQYREDKVSFGMICYSDYNTVLLSVLLHTLGYKDFLLLCRSGVVQRRPESSS